MKVLLGVGGTDDSVRALEQTVDRVREAGDELTVAVLDNPESDPAPEDVEGEVRETLDAAGLDAEVRRVEGDPGSRLVEIAEHEGFDQIVIGGGQTSPMGKIKIGQIAEFVLLNSHVTVTLVR
jgi:nucleotide-binding universal stress UspA family protein